MSKSEYDQVCAIVVTYFPDLNKLKKLLESAIPQVQALIVIDNGSDEKELSYIRDWSSKGIFPSFSLLELGENIGIAAALNKGIAWARKDSYSHVLFFDQDSQPANNMVSKLLHELNQLKNCGTPVAAVGPKLVDLRTRRNTPFVIFNWYGVTRMHCDDSTVSSYCTDFLVSSGMVIPVDVLDQVGLLNEDLFIDNVDLEWSFRARSLGFKLYGVCDAVMLHSVGDQVVTIGSKAIYRHSPIRQYYIMRNRILLYKKKHSPIAWIVQDIPRSIFKTLMFSLFFSPRRENIFMMLRGVKDACTGKLGKYGR